MKVLPYHHDPLLALVYKEEEAIDLFGKEYFDEYSVEIPDEIANEVHDCYSRLIKAQKKLEQILKEKGHL